MICPSFKKKKKNKKKKRLIYVSIEGEGVG